MTTNKNNTGFVCMCVINFDWSMLKGQGHHPSLTKKTLYSYSIIKTHKGTDRRFYFNRDDYFLAGLGAGLT
jgi:hypothetical protein